MNKIKTYFLRHKARKEAIKVLGHSLRTTDAHLVAIARLSFIKPSLLTKEAKNHKANAEYLLKMTEERENEK